MVKITKEWIMDNIDRIPVGETVEMEGFKMHGEPWWVSCFQIEEPSIRNAKKKSKEILVWEDWDDFVYLRPGEGNDTPYGLTVFYKDVTRSDEEGYR